MTVQLVPRGAPQETPGFFFAYYSGVGLKAKFGISTRSNINSVTRPVAGMARWHWEGLRP
jgi:hypothetical protein